MALNKSDVADHCARRSLIVSDNKRIMVEQLAAVGLDYDSLTASDLARLLQKESMLTAGCREDLLSRLMVHLTATRGRGMYYFGSDTDVDRSVRGLERNGIVE
jgi:hypothetical protein